MSHDGHCPAIKITVPTNTASCQCELIRAVRDNQRGFDIRQQVEERDAFRAKVEALRNTMPHQWVYQQAITDVLALFDGGA